MIVKIVENFIHIYEAIFEKELLEEMIAVGTFKTLQAGDAYLRPAGIARGVPIIIFGILKVLREDHEGHLVLYFLKSGETCSLSLSKHPKMQQREIRAVAQLETRLLIVPNEYLDKWICEYPSWQNFVFQTYLKPIYTLLGALDSYVFFKEEDQVYRYLQSMQIY